MDEQLLIGQINQAQDSFQRAKVGSVLDRTQGAGLSRDEARVAAEEFEAVFIGQMLRPMFETLPTDGAFGGGHAEKVYRSMFVDEVAKEIAQSGGVGIADHVMRDLIGLQEG